MPSPEPDATRVHTGVALAILGVAGGICLALLVLAHSPTLETRMREFRWEEAKRTKNVFWPVGHLYSDPDRVLNEEIPSVDHRRGGVYFMGASGIQGALRLWKLPPESRNLIHNYGLQGTGHFGQSLLLRYLVERKGLLEAGADKTLVLFGSGYQNVILIENDQSILSSALALRGYYVRGPGRSIERSQFGSLRRMVSIERSRLYGIAGELKQMIQRMINDRLGHPRSPRVLDPQEFKRVRTLWMGTDWREKIDRDLDTLLGAVDYLRTKGVPVAVILMPQGSWEDYLPFDRAFSENLIGRCRARGVKVLDLRKLLDDDDFADSTHLLPTGVEKFQRAVLPTCLDHLRSAGLLPEGDPHPP